MSTQEVPQTEVRKVVAGVQPAQLKVEDVDSVLVSVPRKDLDFVVASLSGGRACAATNLRDSTLEPHSKAYYLRMYAALDGVVKQLV